MTLAQMLAAAQEQLRAALATRQTAQDALLALRSDPNITEEAVNQRTATRDAADAAVDAARAEVERLEGEIARDAELDQLAQRVTPAAARPVGGARVTSEPEVYRRGGGNSYFRDLVNATTRGNRDAADRLVRNDRQVLETRALSTTDGAGGKVLIAA